MHGYKIKFSDWRDYLLLSLISIRNKFRKNIQRQCYNTHRIQQYNFYRTGCLKKVIFPFTMKQIPALHRQTVRYFKQAPPHLRHLQAGLPVSKSVFLFHLEK